MAKQPKAGPAKPNLKEFRAAVRAMYDCPCQVQHDALHKIIAYAAAGAGYTDAKIQPKTLRTKRPFAETTSQGWPL